MPRRLAALTIALAVLTSSCSTQILQVMAGDAPHPTAAALATLRAALTNDVQTQPTGTLSIIYEDMTSHQSITLNAQQMWDPASMIKLFVMADAYAERAAGTLDFTKVITINDDNVVPTAGFTDGQYPGLLPGATATVDTLIAMMITQSDNTAYNTLLDLLGRTNVTAYAHQLGLSHTTIGRKLNLDGDELTQDEQVAHGVENRTTPDDVAAFFKLLYNNQVPLAVDMLQLLDRQKQNYMLPAGLPAGTVMAHKVGEIGDTLRHDAGIAYLPDGGICLIVVFSSLGSYAEVSMIAQQIANAYVGAVATPPPPAQMRPSSPRLSLANLHGIEITSHVSWLAPVLRLVLLLAALSLIALGFVVNRGGILPGGRPRPQDQ